MIEQINHIPNCVRTFEFKDPFQIVEAVRKKRKLFITGSEPSCLFPAGNTIYSAMRGGLDIQIVSENARQAGEYDLSEYVVCAFMTTQQDQDTQWFLNRLNMINHPYTFCLIGDSAIQFDDITVNPIALTCRPDQQQMLLGQLIESALFYQSITAAVINRNYDSKLSKLADRLQTVSSITIDAHVISPVRKADTVFIVGRNDGIGKDLTCRIMAMTAKKAIFLEGAAFIDSCIDIIEKKDVVILINPFHSIVDRIKQELVDKKGVNVLAVTDEDLPFNSIKVDYVGELQNYVYMTACWRLLAECI